MCQDPHIKGPWLQKQLCAGTGFLMDFVLRQGAGPKLYALYSKGAATQYEETQKDAFRTPGISPL